MATVHIIGAGISGLAAATALADAHVPVKLYEAATSAGGRARSTNDVMLGMLDCGLHLFSGAAHELQRFIRRIGSEDQFTRLPLPITISDVTSGESWKIGPKSPMMTAPLLDHIQLAGHLLSPDAMPVSRMVSELSPLQDAFLSPLSRLALTQPSHQATARQMQRLLRRQMKRGATRLYMAKESLQQSFITPALARLEYLGGSAYFGQALQRIEMNGACHLHFARKKLALESDDVVILATPAHATQNLLPQLKLDAPQYRALTLHFQIAHHETVGSMRVLTNAACDLLRYDDGMIRASIRIAEGAWNSDEEALATRVWRDIRRVHPYLKKTALPTWAIRREKRAGHVPSDMPHRLPELPPRLLLAGDWLDATRPSTMEAAALFGHRAAERALQLVGRQASPSQHDFYLN